MMEPFATRSAKMSYSEIYDEQNININIVYRQIFACHYASKLTAAAHFCLMDVACAEAGPPIPSISCST
jgi:hypothetical protein